jgi:predicted ribosome-associated RNA-binding protein Tma20
MAIGVLQMSSDEILKEKKGEAIQVVQFLNDGIWFLKAV